MKDIIYYHRAYRKAAVSGKGILLEFLFVPLPLLIIIFFLYPDITFFMNQFAKAILESALPSSHIKMLEKPHMLSTVHIVSLPGKYPSPLLSFLLFLVSLLCIYLLPKTIFPTPVRAWAIFVSSINLISSVFFIITPFIFPYNIEDFSELYVKTEVGIWFFVPVIMGIASLLLPTNTISKLSITTLTLLYSIIFGILRYTIFLYILKTLSYLFMPLLFFAFGPLMDFTYMVGIYSLYSSIIAIKRNKRTELGIWRWS